MEAPWLRVRQRQSTDHPWETIAQLRHYQEPWGQHDRAARSPFRGVYGVDERDEAEKV